MTNTYTQNVQMVGVDSSGDVQGINVGKTDNNTPIYFELETQEIEFGNRAHLKNISDNIVAFIEYGIDTSLEAKEDDGNYKPIPFNLNNSVNIGKDINLEGHYFTFKWFGESDSTSPIFEGIYLENIVDLGIVKT